MTGRGKSGNLMSRLGAKMPGASKRSRQCSSNMPGTSLGSGGGGPSAKKAWQAPVRKAGASEDLAKDKVDVMPVFDVPLPTLANASPIIGVEEANAAIADEREPSSLIAGVIAGCRASDRRDRLVIGAVCEYVSKLPAEKLNNPELLSLLFALIATIEVKDVALHVANCISTVLRAVPFYPPILIHLVINDAVGRRAWLDTPNAIQFFYSVIFAFGEPKLPTANECTAAEIAWCKKVPYERDTYPLKFDFNDEFLSFLRNSLATFVNKLSESPSKNMLRLSCFLVYQNNVAEIISSKLDSWLQTVMLQRYVNEVLLSIALNIKMSAPYGDTKKIIDNLVAVNTSRARQSLSVLTICFDMIVRNDIRAMPLIMESILEFEFSSNQKTSHTYTLISNMYAISPQEASKNMASTIVRNLSKPTLLRQIQSFCREITKFLFRNPDFNIADLARCCFESAQSMAPFTPEFLQNVVGFVGLLQFSLASIQCVRDAFNATKQGIQLTSQQSEAWTRFRCQGSAFLVVGMEFMKWATLNQVCMSKLLFELFTFLAGVGDQKGFAHVMNDPTAASETEFAQTQKMIFECPVHDGALKAIVDSRNGSLPNFKLVFILEKINFRILATSPYSNTTFFQLKDVSVFDGLLSVAAVPSHPSLAYANIYTRAWLLVFQFAVMNRHGIMGELYERYPVMRVLVRTVLTTSSKTAVDCALPAEKLADSAQVAKEKTEAKAYLLDLDEGRVPAGPKMKGFNSRDVCIFNPTGPPRIHQSLIDHLAKVNADFRLHSTSLGALLCEVRQPDYIEELINDEFMHLAVPTLQEAIEKIPDIVYTLPISAIILLFFGTLPESTKAVVKKRLAKVLTTGEPKKDTDAVVNVFMNTLKSPDAEKRHTAMDTLQDLLCSREQKGARGVMAFTKLPNFKEYADFICRELAVCAPTEPDQRRVLEYIRFIATYMKSLSIKIIAPRLSAIFKVQQPSHMSGDVIEALTDLFGLFMQVIDADEKQKVDLDVKPDIGKLKKTQSKNNSSAEAQKPKIYHLKFPKSGRVVKVDGSMILAIVKMLLLKPTKESKSHGRDFLADLFFNTIPSQRAQLIADGQPMPIVRFLTKDVYRSMLASTDNRILSMALESVTPHQARGFLTSFAVAPQAYSKIVSLVNEERPPPKELLPAVLFLRAYSLKGVKEAEELLKYVESDEEVKLRLRRPESPEIPHFSLSAETATTTVAEELEELPDVMEPRERVNEYLDATDGQAAAKVGLSMSQLSSYLEDIAHAKAVIERAKRNGLFITDTLNDVDPRIRNITFVVKILARKSPEHSNLLSKISEELPDEHTLKSVIVPPSAPPKDDVGKLSPDEILSRLRGNDAKRLPPLQVTHMIQRFKQFRPEIVDITAPREVFVGHVVALFSADSEYIEKLIDDIVASSNLLTIRRVLDFLLECFEEQIKSSLVIRYIDRCVNVPDSKSRVVPTIGQTPVLIDYIVVQATIDPTDKSHSLPKFLAVLDAILLVEGQDAIAQVVAAISSKLKHALVPPIDGPVVDSINYVVDVMEERFVGCRSVVNRAKHEGDLLAAGAVKVQPMSDAHKRVIMTLNQAVIMMMTCPESQLDVATNMLFSVYNVVAVDAVAKHIPSLVNRLSLYLNTAVIRESEPNAIRLFESILRVVLRCSPYSYEDSKTINSLLQQFFDYFVLRSGTRYSAIFSLLTDVSIDYSTRQPEAASAFLLSHVDFFMHVQKHFKFEHVSFLLRQINHIINRGIVV